MPERAPYPHDRQRNYQTTEIIGEKGEAPHEPGAVADQRSLRLPALFLARLRHAAPAALSEQLEAATGERIAALEAVEPDRAKGREAILDTNRSADLDGGAAMSREREWTSSPEMEHIRAPKSVDRELGL